MIDEKLEQLRSRAEAALGEGDIIQFMENASASDYKSALTEMAIYQAELLAQHEDLEEANQRVTQSASKLSQLLDLMEDPYVILDHHLRVIDANRAAERALNLKQAQGFDNYADFFAANDRALIKAWLAESPDDQTIDVSAKGPEKGRYTLKKHAFQDDTVLVIARDITELQTQTTLAEQLKHSLLRIEELQNERETAFAFLAHEMRTPASTIAMLLETDSNLRQTDTGHLIETNIHQVLSLMDDLKVVIRPDAEVFKEQSTVDLAVVVRDIVASHASLFNKQGISVHVDVSERLKRSPKTNLQSVKQVVTNLVKNAALHSGGTELWVNLDSLPLKDRLSVLVKVSDNGKGVPDSDKARIFLPFERGACTTEGTGIGLDVCKRLAKQLHGNVTLKDRQGGGSEFTFSFYAEVEQVPADSEQSSGKDIQSLDGLSVLFVDDDVMIRKLSATILSRLGAQVVVASDGEDALKQLKRHEFGLVITDIMMPNLDGIGLTRALRARHFEGTILGCSAATVGDELDSLLAAGADAVMPKPLTSKGLLTVLSNYPELLSDQE